MDSRFQKNDKELNDCLGRMGKKVSFKINIREKNAWLRFLDDSGKLTEISKICNSEVQILDVGFFSFYTRLKCFPHISKSKR